MSSQSAAFIGAPRHLPQLDKAVQANKTARKVAGALDQDVGYLELALDALMSARDAVGRGEHNNAGFHLCQAIELYPLHPQFLNSEHAKSAQRHAITAQGRLAAMSPAHQLTVPTLPADLLDSRGSLSPAQAPVQATARLPEPEEVLIRLRKMYPQLKYCTCRGDEVRLQLVRNIASQAPDIGRPGRPLVLVDLGAGDLLQLALQAHELVRLGHLSLKLVAIDPDGFGPVKRDSFTDMLAELEHNAGAKIDVEFYISSVQYYDQVVAESQPAPDMLMVVDSSGSANFLAAHQFADKVRISFTDGQVFTINLPFSRAPSRDDITAMSGNVNTAERMQFFDKAITASYNTYQGFAARIGQNGNQMGFSKHLWRQSLSTKIKSLETGQVGHVVWVESLAVSERLLTGLNPKCLRFRDTNPARDH